MTNIQRRTFLRASGIALGLPWLPSLAFSEEKVAQREDARRMVAICAP